VIQYKGADICTVEEFMGLLQAVRVVGKQIPYIAKLGVDTPKEVHLLDELTGIIRDGRLNEDIRVIARKAYHRVRNAGGTTQSVAKVYNVAEVEKVYLGDEWDADDYVVKSGRVKVKEGGSI